MSSATTMNFHIPLPAVVYKALKAEATRQKRPATQLAREAIVRTLAEARRLRTEAELRHYVARTAGTSDDLDMDLLALAEDNLLRAAPWK